MENEITVNVNMSKNDLIKHLETNGFNRIYNEILDDIYYIKKNTDFKNNILDILNNAILIRKIYIKETHKIHKFFTYKNKIYDKNENIIKQTKNEVEILNINDAKKFLKSLKYPI